MRIGFDISSVLPPRTGIGNYTLQLIDELLRLPDCRNSQFQLLLNSFRRSGLCPRLAEHPALRINRRRIPGPWLLTAWQYANWPPVELLNGSVDLFHAPATIVPPQRRGKRIATVHDLWFLQRPADCDKWGGQYIRKRLAQTIRQLDAVIAVSEFTRGEILGHYGVAPENVIRVYNGLDPRFAQPPAAGAALLRDERGRPLPAEYLLSLSTLEPRKNFGGLLRAYELAAQREPNLPPLVLAGMIPLWHKTKAVGEITELLSRPAISERIYITGFVPDGNLPALYRGAALFVLPSFCEGFGLPVLEALASGAPVACSRGSALDEIGGAAAWRFDPENRESIAETLLAALGDSAERNRRIELGRRHAANFSWHKCAAETYAVYQRVLQR